MKRYLQIDFVRGLLLIIMTIDHLSSPLRRFTYQSFGFVSGAEGFVFVSGLVAGIVFTRMAIKNGTDKASHRMLIRSFEIYQYHIAVLIILVVLIFTNPYVGAFWTSEDPLFLTRPWLAVILSATFFYQPDHLNILPIYCMFLLFAPIALKLLLKEKFLLLLGISIGLWCISILGFRDVLAQKLSTFVPVDLGYFNVYSWQLLFFTGMLIGYLKSKDRLTSFMRNKNILVVCLIICGILFFVRHFVTDNEFANSSFLTDKTDLGPLRLLNFYALTYVIAYLQEMYTHTAKFKPVVFLGKHSLQVFAFHVVLTIIVMPVTADLERHLSALPFNFNNTLIKLAEIVVVLLSVLALFIPAFLNDSYRKRKQRMKAAT